MAQLKELLEAKWGVKAASGMPMMAMAAGPVAAPSTAVESVDFQVTLSEAPADKKLSIIKVLREVAALALKDAKDFVDAAPKVIKESSPKAEAEDIKKKIEAAGGKVTLKGL